VTLNLTKTSLVTFENLNSTEVDRQSPTGLIFVIIITILYSY